MEGVKVPSESIDATGLRVLVALLPSLLSEEGALNCLDGGGRVSKATYKAILERIA